MLALCFIQISDCIILDQRKDMNKFIFFIFIAISLQQETLPLSTPITITLESHLSKSYLIQLPEKIEVDQDLFITSVPLLEIPTQIPILTLNGSAFNKSFIYSKNQLEGVCTVNNKELAALSNSSLVLTIWCIEACTFILEAYLNDVVTLAYSTNYKIKPTSDSLAIFQFELPVPQSSFDEVRIQALIEVNDAKVERGVEMYANVGNYGALLPNQYNYQYKAVSVHKGVGINIGKEQLPKGTWIKIALFTNSKVTITLSAESAVGSTQQLTFGKRKSCFLAKDIQTSFIIDLKSTISQISEKDINLMITIYSGFPEVKVSFDSSYQQVIENYGVGGNLNYLFTSKFRKEGNFTGKIYLNAKSDAQSYFQIFTSINPKEYIYMKESNTYISQLQPLSLANYIFDSYYDLPKEQNESDYLYFTIKLKALLGEGYFACRMCNQQSIFNCLLNNSAQFSGKDFENDVQNLPGNILVYYSLYQIFLYSQVQQCRIVGSDSLSTRYLCRIHIVSYNFESTNNLEWALTAYTRQKGIILSQGNPFKDMIYEDSYNYYSFTIPPNANAVDVFLTVLSGEATLVTSQYYFFPQLLFANIDGNDIKVHLDNHNRYYGKQLNGQIYIGVYGKGVAEYLVNVVVRRNETNALVSLIPQMQQFFDIAKGAAMKFKLTMGSERPWVVEIIELLGSVSTSLTNKTTSSPICSQFLKCSFQATAKEELFLSVKTTEDARISINYYPQQSCRMFSMGIASFIQIDPNTKECASFIINPDKDLQISYSENILHSLSTNLLVSLEIGQHQLGNLESHQLLVTKQQLKAFCKSSNNTQARTCSLQLTFVGDLHSKVELQFSVIDHQSPIPIYDGMTIPFTRRPFKKDTPAYFYYYSLSTKTPTVFIRSFNYQSYIVAFKWINYTTFLNSSTQIYPSLPSRIDYKTSFDLSLYYRHLEAKPFLPAQCSECLLLVSIFAYEDYKETALQLEIVREEGYIEIGQTVRGTLSKQDFLAYQLQKGDSKGKSVITLHNYKEGQGCYKVVLEESSKQQNSFAGNEIVIPNPNKTNILTIISSQDNCKFQISYWLLDSPIRIIQSGYSYSLSLNNSLSAYFLYYHQANQTFRLFESIKQGYVYSYATPVNSNLQETFNTGKFLFGGESIYDGIQIGPSDANYCFKCYYLIKVVGAPSVYGSIGIADSYTRIQMREDEVIREKVTTGGSRYYSHPPNKFKLKVNIVYGVVKAIITDLADGQYFQETLKADREFDLAPRNSSAGFVFNFSIIQTSTYTLQIDEGNKTRLIEGYPMTCKFIANEPFIFSFSRTVGKSFNLLLMIDQDKFEYPSIIILVTTLQSNKTLQSSAHVGNIYSFDIAGEATDYTIRIVVNSTIRIKVLVARNKLTYLQDSTPFLSRDSTIYQVFTAGHPIMLELFSCRGDVKLTASAKYPELLQANPDDSISLSHSNIGGHYVISSQSREKEFYALVQSHSLQAPLYTISYTSVKAIPYKYFDTIQRNIEYKIDHKALEIKFEVPALVDKKKTFKNMKAEFKLIIADEGGDFNALTQCEMGIPLMSQYYPITSFPPSETSTYKHTIPKDQLQKLFNKKLQTFYLGIVLKINYDEGLQTRKLTYIYETLEVPIAFTNQANIQTENALSFIFFWIVIPIIIGGTIAWLSFGYCLKKLKMMRTGDNELIEEESEVQIQGKSNNQIQNQHQHSNKK